MNWHPLRFAPIYQERVWGGRQLSELYHRQLSSDSAIGESWEITDRPGAASVVSQGSLAGRSLSELLKTDPRGLVGDALTRDGRFPLLVKILDAREVLSLQVHPPAVQALALGGEPKTEMWYFARAKPGAEILAGLRRGSTRNDFERRLGDGTAAECVHRIPVRAGDAMFLPSGRLHALGAGLVLFEIQENSDTTYRVFDWNRTGLDGKPRALHIRESMQSIDFSDIEPKLLESTWHRSETSWVRPLVDDACFRVEARRAQPGNESEWELRRCAIIGVVRGSLEVGEDKPPVVLGPGDFCLLPAGLGRVRIRPVVDAEWLVAEPGPR